MAKAIRSGAKPGRPPLADAEKLGSFTGIRWSDQERKILAAKVAEAGYPTVSAYVRAVALRAKLAQVRAINRADPELVLALNRIGVNLNQIAKIVNTGRATPHGMLDETLQRLNDELDRLQGIT
jgi:hypothetical protein